MPHTMLRFPTVKARTRSVAQHDLGAKWKTSVKKQIYKNRELALTDVADYIETFYNRTCRHSHRGGVSPEQFEAAHKPRRQAVY